MSHDHCNVCRPKRHPGVASSTIGYRLLGIAARFSWVLALAPIVHLILHIIGVPHSETIGFVP